MLTLSALVKPEKSLFFLERIGTKIVRQAHYEGHKKHKRDKKNGQEAPFFGHPFSIEIRTISPIISLKYAEFVVLTPVYGVRGQAGIVVLTKKA